MDAWRLPQHDVERLWAEEVLYLHSLWRRGPPSNRNRKPSPSPRAGPAPAAFKKKSKGEKRRAKEKASSGQPDVACTSDPTPAAEEQEWPSAPALDPNAASAKWDNMAPGPPPDAESSPPVFAEEQACLAAAQVQHNGLNASRDFFSKEEDSDDEEEEHDEEEESALDDMDGPKMGAFKFFMELFEKDDELRKYYEKNYEKGEFPCFACAGGLKRMRRFQNCMGLVQHANSISKTKRKGAHRALARVVCQVLGWDINRLPSFVLDMGDTLGQSLAKVAMAQKNVLTTNEKEDILEEEESLLEDMTHNMEVNNGKLTENLPEKGEVIENEEDLPEVTEYDMQKEKVVENKDGLPEVITQNMEANDENLTDYLPQASIPLQE